MELHAGEEYAEAIVPALRGRGAAVSRPLQGLRIGEQLKWYGDRLGSETPRPLPSTTPLIREVHLGDGRGLSQKITKAFVSGGLDLRARPRQPKAVGWEGMPEVIAATALDAAGASPADVRLFLTFTAAMDRARDADKLAASGVELVTEAPWVYRPEEVIRRSLTELADALRLYKVSQRHMMDGYAWRMLAENLAGNDCPASVRSAIYDGIADARDLFQALASTTAAGTARFPLLSGPKIGPLWIRLLAHPGQATISSLEVVPVAVDVQVRKVTEYLGVTNTGPLELPDARPIIEATWSADVAKHGAAGPPAIEGTAGALDPALWFYAKWGCSYCEQVRKRLPIAAPCAGCRYPARS